MLNRRSFLKASATALVSLTGLTAIVNDSQAYPKFDSILQEQYTRESMIFSYEEYKELKKIPDPPKTDEELYKLRNIQNKLRKKIKLILKNPEKAFSFLTDKEKESYELELHMFDREDIPIYCAELNIRYNLMNFELTPEQFKTSLGPKILWFLDEYYGYMHTDKNAGRKK